MGNNALRILSTIGLGEHELELVRAAAPQAEVVQLSERPGWLNDVCEFDAWLAHGAHVCAAPSLGGGRLRWVQLSSAGAENVFASCQIDADMIYTNASGVQSVGIAEYAVMTLLSFARHYPHLLDLHRQRHWPAPKEIFESLMVDELRDATLGLVGYGSISSAIAHLAQPFGMRILACKRDPSTHRVPRWNPPGAGDPAGELPAAWYGTAQVTDMLSVCDYVVSAIPLTPATRGIIGEDAFRAMRPSTVFINVGRGGLVQEPALARALREGWIAGAAVDVVSHEPLPADSELYDVPKLFISPHISSATTKYYARMTELFTENLSRYQAGLPLLNVLDRTKGY